MCGRYYITPAALREAAELAEGPETEKDTAQRDKDTAQRDVCPGESAPVLLARGLRTESVRMTWGFPRQEGKGLLINARAETAWEKPTFRDSIHSRRCVILAGGKRRSICFEEQMEQRCFWQAAITVTGTGTGSLS